MAGGADSPMQQAAADDCPVDVASEFAGISCDGEEIPARAPGCPMLMSSCTSMGSASGHCGLVSVTDNSAVPDARLLVARVVFLRNAIRGSGRVSDPIFHPPIL